MISKGYLAQAASTPSQVFPTPHQPQKGTKEDSNILKLIIDQ